MPRGTSTPPARRLLALVASCVVTAALVTVSGAPAHARGRPTDFAFQSFAYGTKVKATAGELRSGRTAPSWIGCTREVDKTRANEVLGVDAPSGNPMVDLGTVTSRSTTYRDGAHGITAGTQSSSTVASVVLGDDDAQVPTPVLTIEGLTTTATAWAAVDGTLHAATDSQVLDIDLAVPPTGTPLDGPLAELVGLVNGPAAPSLDGVLTLLQQHQGAIEIPGLGRLELGYSRTGVGTRQAVALALSLRVTLYGADGAAGGADDSTVKIGRSYARIIGDMPSAVLSGAGWAADADLAGGTAHVGDIVPQRLPCQGTDGATRSKSLASAILPGVSLSGLEGRSQARTTRSGKVRAWTAGSVAHVALGSGDTALTIDGVVGRANLVTDRRGHVVRRDIAGTMPGILTVNGQTYALPLDRAPDLPAELASLVQIETGVVDTSDARALRVTALRVTLLQGTAAGTVVNLGNAKVDIRKS